MSADQFTRRNRANAKKSTGPRTARGKARVAGNARKHGATAQPDRQRVATWLAIILDQPEISGQDFTPTDDRGYRALALAQAEARLNAAEQALRDLVQQHPAISPREERSFDDFAAEVLGDLAHTVHKHARVAAVLKSAYAIQLSTLAKEGRERHRLLRRYLAEARSRRRKAFAAWLEVCHPAPAIA